MMQRRRALWLSLVKGVATVLLTTSLGSGGSAAQSSSSEQKTLATQLQSRSWNVRREAVTKILAIAPSERLPVLVENVVRELTRLQGLPGEGAGEVPRGSDLESSFEYYADLVEIASSSENPIVIEPLVRAIQTGGPAFIALARFGDAAAPQLLAAARARKADPDFVWSSLITFRMMIEQHPMLSASSRVGIAALARDSLIGTRHTAVLQRAIEVVVALRDVTFVPDLTRIAEARSSDDAGLVLVGGATFESIRTLAKRALSKLR
jgi:hypothetical protein